MQTSNPKSNRTARLSAALFAVGLAAFHSSAADYTWIGAAGADWSESANWSPSGTPNAISDSVTVNSLGLINFTNVPATAFTVGNITNTGNGSSTLGANSTTDDVITLAVSSGSPVLNVGNSAGQVFSYVTLGGTQGFTKAGPGKWTMRYNGAANTFAGGINILGGILGINQNSSLGDDNNDIAIGNGARLTAEPGSNSGTITLPSTRTITLNGAQSQMSASAVAVELAVEGDVVGTGGLVKVDAGKLSLNGTATYAGMTRVVGGILDFNLPSGTFTNLDEILVQGLLGTKLDFSDLTSFTMNNSSKNFAVLPSTSTTTGQIAEAYLANGSGNGGTNLLTASQVNIGGASGSNVGDLHEGRLHLGTVNTIQATSLRVGGFNGRGLVDFQTSPIAPSLTLRAADGTSRMPGQLKIGETSSGLRSGGGDLNLAGGVFDALLTDTIIGRHISNANNPETSTLIMDNGNVDTLTLLLADKAGTGTPILTSTFTENGGTVKAQTITMGQDAAAGATASLRPTYNLNAGTLFAGTIQAGAGAFGATSARNLNLNGGTLRNYDANTDLNVSGVAASSGGLLNTVLAAGAQTIQADAGRKITFSDTAPISGDGGLTKEGTGSLILNAVNTYVGDTLVNAGTLGGSGTIAGSVTVQPGATLAPGASVGTLTINGNLTLAGNLFIEVDKALSPASDSVSVAGSLANTGTGTLTITNIGATALAAGDVFTLFNQPMANGSALKIVGPAGTTWANNLAVDGTVSVVSTTVAQPTLTYELDGSNWVFNWTGSGFKLQTQTNSLSVGLNSNWVDVPGGNVSGVSVPGPNASNPAVFFRLISTP